MNLRSFSILQIALGASIAVHATLLAVRFVDPAGFERVFKDMPMEVILVNAKSNDPSDNAKFIAQHTLAGGGNDDQGHATTPLPPSAMTQMGDATEDEQRKIEAMQAQQTQLLAQLRQQLATMPRPDPQNPSTANEAAAVEEKRRQLFNLLAEIERRVNEQNTRPQKRYIGPATREESYAVYYDKLRRRIEDRGTENFPSTGGRKLYGELIMLITVDSAGRVLETEVVQSSGNVSLDRRAMEIARSAGPFGRFSDDMRRKAEQIVMASRFKFTRNDTLETRAVDASAPAN